MSLKCSLTDIVRESMFLNEHSGSLSVFGSAPSHAYLTPSALVGTRVIVRHLWRR